MATHNAIESMLFMCCISAKSKDSAERQKASQDTQHDKSALIQIDFSENYMCVSQDEVQSAHWNQLQSSLFRAAVWHSGSLHSRVIASDDLTHSKDTVLAYLDLLLEDLPEKVTYVSVWSDGPASQ